MDTISRKISERLWNVPDAADFLFSLQNRAAECPILIFRSL